MALPRLKEGQWEEPARKVTRVMMMIVNGSDLVGSGVEIMMTMIRVRRGGMGLVVAWEEAAALEEEAEGLEAEAEAVAAVLETEAEAVAEVDSVVGDAIQPETRRR